MSLTLLACGGAAEPPTGGEDASVVATPEPGCIGSPDSAISTCLDADGNRVTGWEIFCDAEAHGP